MAIATRKEPWGTHKFSEIETFIKDEFDIQDTNIENARPKWSETSEDPDKPTQAEIIEQQKATIEKLQARIKELGG